MGATVPTVTLPNDRIDPGVQAMRILVAEDDPGTPGGHRARPARRAATRSTRSSGATTPSTSSSWYEYDVAIIDWRMPGAEGIDVVAWARRNDKPTALLMLTARDAPADRIRGLDTGADDYLVKPFDFGELLARVRALQRRPARRRRAGPRARPASALDPVTPRRDGRAAGRST